MTDQVRPEYTGCTKHTEVALLPLFEPIRKAHAVVVVTVMSFSFSDDWWGKAENYSYEAVYSYMSHSLQGKRLPQTYGLFLDETLIGMYQFTMEDLFSRPDIYPWLANVYIDKAYRAYGYGRVLLNSVKKTAEKAGLKELYLFTTHEGLYEKFGWDFIQEIDTFLEPRTQRLYRLDTNSRLMSR